jgi:hypothetical protein
MLTPKSRAKTGADRAAVAASAKRRRLMWYFSYY